MNSLAIDCAVSKIAVAVKKDSMLSKLVLNIGTKQSEKLLPSIDYVLNELDIKPSELDYTAITLGPGSFTGLRLGLSSLKALTLSGKTPIYGIPSLEAYAWPFRSATETILSVIEAKEDEYYYQFFMKGKMLSQPEDKSIEDILKLIDTESCITVCGPGAKSFCSRTGEISPLHSARCFTPENDSTESMFEIAEEMIRDKKAPLQDYDGPLYVRKSEAEIVYEQKKAT